MATLKKLAAIPLLSLVACYEPDLPSEAPELRRAADVAPEVQQTVAGIQAAITVRGRVSLEDDALVDGTDAVPPGWACDGCTLEDRPGIILRDLAELEIDDDAVVSGDPPALADPTIGDATFQDFGTVTWDEVTALATQTVGEFGGDVTLRPGGSDRKNRYGPHKNPDGSCDTDHPLNFGSNDPDDPCYDHFPIVLLRGEVEIKGDGYIQGLFIMDFDAAGVGGELDLEGDGLVLAGIVLGRGCIEIQDESRLYGAIYLDGAAFNPSNCPPDDPVHLQEHGEVRWSSLVTRRVLTETGVLEGGPTPPPGYFSRAQTILFGSSALSDVNPASLFRIDEASGLATLVGPSGLTVGSDRISALDFDPFSGRLYGIKGGACHGAILITIDPATGQGSVVGTLQGAGLDFTPGPDCPGGSDALAFAADGTMYVGGWYGGDPQGKIMKLDRKTATVLEYHLTPIGFDDWRGRRAHIPGMAVDANGTVWVSRGASIVLGQINTIDPATADITSTLYLTDPQGNPEIDVTISDLAFAPDGTLYASLPWENMLGVIDTVTGVLTRLGTFGPSVNRISGLTAEPAILQHLLGRYWFREAGSGQGPATLADDRQAPVDLAIEYTPAVSWVTRDGHRGLSSSAFKHRGIVRGRAGGTKYVSALDGSTRATFVTVASWTDPPYVQRIAGFQSASGRRVAMLQTGSNGWPSAQFRTTRQPQIDVRWRLDLDDDVRRVFHLVYDAEDSEPRRRIRLYVDGVDQGGGTLMRGRFPELGEGLDFGVEGLELQMMNRKRRNSKALVGTVFYYAVYTTALSPYEIGGNAHALLADDDDLP
jgi:streptogramin lyase